MYLGWPLLRYSHTDLESVLVYNTTAFTDGSDRIPPPPQKPNAFDKFSAGSNNVLIGATSGQWNIDGRERGKTSHIYSISYSYPTSPPTPLQIP